MKNWKLYIWRVLEGIGIIAAIFGLVLQYQSLQEQKILGAWQLITTKVSGNSGKIQALEFLNSKGVPLVGVDLSKAYLRGVNLKGANLQGADFELADLSDAHFEGADLQNTKFKGADLSDAHFEGANLSGARFYGVNQIGDIILGEETYYTRPQVYKLVPLNSQQAKGVTLVELVKK